ncbi:MAG: hypothetical protein F4156_01600 [Holophagales bacterium]|nr:hypothetical protein [Holophagales bacterium]
MIDHDRRSPRTSRGAPVVSGGREARELLTLGTGGDEQKTETRQQAATHRADTSGLPSTGPEPQ